MAPSPEWQLDRYRAFLRLRVRQLKLDPRLRRRFDSSDVVQDTLLRAHARLGGFRGQTEAELFKWLQQILDNVLIDKFREETARKRDVRLEQALPAILAESSARLDAFVADRELSPSQQAERQELLLRVAAALEQLPEDQRDVVIQRDLLGVGVAEIAAQLGRTGKAVAGLLLRGRRKLRELLADYQ